MFNKKPILAKKNILLGLEKTTRDEAIKRAASLLINDGYVSSEYLDAMFAREEIVSTYIVGKQRGLIKTSGVVVLQYPEGIDYNGETAYLVIGISGKDNDHIKILSNIAEQLGEIEKAQELWKTTDLEAVFDVFTNGE